MTAWKFGLYITEADAVPNADVYDMAGIKFNPSIIPPGEFAPQFAVLQNNGGIIKQAELNDILVNNTKRLWLCGIIRYEDTFRSKLDHETRICYQFGTWIPGRDPFFTLRGPDEYNKTT